MSKEWICPKDCPGVPAYGYECPDDLLGGEVCPEGQVVTVDYWEGDRQRKEAKE